MLDKPRDNAQRLAAEIEAAKVIRQGLLDLTDDPDAIRDTLEGGTNLDSLIERAHREIEEDELLLPGIDKRAEELADRKRRLKLRIDLRRSLIATAMQIAEKPKLTLAGATLSLGKKARAAIITDEAAIPSAYWKQPEPTLDKAAVTKALRERAKAIEEAGKIENPAERTDALEQVNALFPPILGAELDNGGVTLSIRHS